MINNSMKSPTTNEMMMREYYIYNMMIPQGREPFHPRKLTGTFMSTLHHERNHENKDRDLTDSSGCDPVDAPPC